MRNKIIKISLTLLLILTAFSGIFSQVSDSIQYIVTLDSVTITAVRNGFSVNDFIQFVEKDTSFYEAFRNLHKVNYQSRAAVRMFDNDHLSKASYTNITKQFVEHNCRHLNFSYEGSTGNFFDDDGGMNYYTSRLLSW